MSTSRAKAKELLREARSKANLNQNTKESPIVNNNLIVTDSVLVEEKILNNMSDLNFSHISDKTSSKDQEISKISQKNNFKTNFGNQSQKTEVNPSFKNSNFNQQEQSKPNNKQNMFIKAKEKEPMKIIGKEVIYNEQICLENQKLILNNNFQTENLNTFEIPKVEDKEKLLKRISSAKQRSQKRLEKQKEMQNKKSEKIFALAQLMHNKQINPQNEEYDKQISNLIENWNDKEQITNKKFLLDQDSDMQMVDDGENI